MPTTVARHALVESTPGIVQSLAPTEWRSHRFGLPPERWDRLSGRTIWVTGAGTGFGQAICAAVAAAGAVVYASGRRREKLDDTVAECERIAQVGDRVVPLLLDITDADAVQIAREKIASGRGSVDGLVSCAALPQPACGPWPLNDCDPTRWRRLLETNVTAQWLVARAALASMASRSGIRIVFMTSEAGWASTPGVGPYNISKAALNSLGTSLAAECAQRFSDRDIQINVLIPGEARTEMNRGSSDSPYTVVPMTLALLSHPAGGPNGYFFHRDGRHFAFARAAAYDRPLL
jgi:NAD(P)-dependent dehydrogenase (short-subunit alcohol dehydrogenase family)